MTPTTMGSAPTRSYSTGISLYAVDGSWPRSFQESWRSLGSASQTSNCRSQTTRSPVHQQATSTLWLAAVCLSSLLSRLVLNSLEVSSWCTAAFFFEPSLPPLRVLPLHTAHDSIPARSYVDKHFVNMLFHPTSDIFHSHKAFLSRLYYAPATKFIFSRLWPMLASAMNFALLIMRSSRVRADFYFARSCKLMQLACPDSSRPDSLLP